MAGQVARHQLRTSRSCAFRVIKKLGQSVLTLTIRFGRDREMSGFNSQALRERDGTGVGLPLP